MAKMRDWGGASSLRPSGSLTQTQFHNIYMTQFINCNNSLFSSSVLLLHVYTGTTCLHIPLAHSCLYYYLLSPQYTGLHILFYCTFLLFIVSSYFIFYLYLYIRIFSCVVTFLHCPLSGPDLIYISLLIIFCIIEYVTNKRNLEPWTLDLQ